MEFRYPKHVHFECERCALCCKDTEKRTRKILLLKEEARRISDTTLENIGNFAERTKESEPYVNVMRKHGGECHFLREGSCSIYEARPIVCRFYPFKLENLGNDRYIFSYTSECPGIGKGPLLQEPFFKELFTRFLGTFMTDETHSNAN